jgi:predicted RNA-binding protein YlqC (UPF0109 family)
MDERPPDPEQTDSDELDETIVDELDEAEADKGDSDDFDDAESDEQDEDYDEEVAVSGPAADLEDLVRYVASRLVQNPDDLTVGSESRGGTVYVRLRVPEHEMGRVIGREGRTAKAIRTLVSIAGSRQNVHARLDIDG